MPLHTEAMEFSSSFLDSFRLVSHCVSRTEERSRLARSRRLGQLALVGYDEIFIAQDSTANTEIFSSPRRARGHVTVVSEPSVFMPELHSRNRCGIYYHPRWSRFQAAELVIARWTPCYSHRLDAVQEDCWERNQGSRLPTSDPPMHGRPD